MNDDGFRRELSGRYIITVWVCRGVALQGSKQRHSPLPGWPRFLKAKLLSCSGANDPGN